MGGDHMRMAVALLLFSLSVLAQAFADDWRAIPLVKDGKVADGWSHVGWGKMVVDEGALRTECDERGLGLLVYTKERFGNCQIRVVYRCRDARANAGVFIRMDDGILGWAGKESIAVRREANGKLSPDMLAKMQEASEKENGAWYAVHHGYEVQIMDSADAAHRTGSLYSLAPAAAVPQKPAAEWRSMVITLQGPLVVVELDGQEVSRFDSAGKDIPARKNWTEPKREPKRPEVGYIGLQTHDPGDVVFFKEISVRPLAK
jgi:3-keto-disaccharide hydrolase